MNFAVISRPRTRAILEGKIKCDGLPINWISAMDTGERHRKILSGQLDGGEIGISAFIQARSEGVPIRALPVFLKRGLVQRSIFCSLDSPLISPEQLRGKRVGLIMYDSSMSVWVRGVLSEGYRVSRSSPLWHTLFPSTQMPKGNTKVVEVPKGFVEKAIKAWEELDGYPQNLDRRELFLMSLLEKGELDATISFQTKIAPNNSARPLIAAEDKFWSHYEEKGVYPINHLFVVREDVLVQYPKIGEVLLAALKESRKLWVDYLPAEERVEAEREMKRLGWDPFACQLGEVEKRTFETFIDYLLEEKMISKRVPLDMLFHKDTIRGETVK